MRLWIIIALFYLNDFAFIAAFAADPSLTNPLILFLDYACRILVLGLIFTSPKMLDPISESLAAERNDGADSVIDFGILFLLIPLVTFTILLLPDIPRTSAFAFPNDVGQSLRIFDLTVGLLLVATTEELVFRKLLLDRFSKLGISAWLAVPFAAIIFAGMHWGSGLHAASVALVFGLFWGAFYSFRKRVGALIVWHYLANLYVFALL